jgi:hypothetical protein
MCKNCSNPQTKLTKQGDGPQGLDNLREELSSETVGVRGQSIGLLVTFTPAGLTPAPRQFSVLLWHRGHRTVTCYINI